MKKQRRRRFNDSRGIQKRTLLLTLYLSNPIPLDIRNIHNLINL